MKSVFIYAVDEISKKALFDIYGNNCGLFWNSLQLTNVKSWDYNQDSFTFTAVFNTGGKITIAPKTVNTHTGSVGGIIFDFSKVKNNELDGELEVAGRIRSIIQQKISQYPSTVQISTGFLE